LHCGKRPFNESGQVLFQRRAAGLAFLLAVHLSRAWCALNTLILDDPVQHIDDYRALHLVEVFSAIRQGGQQVICTAEDEELGQFLCRRLRCSELGEGVSVEMEYSLDRGVRIAKETKVYPLPQGGSFLIKGELSRKDLEGDLHDENSQK
jgi:hypothetical protein